MTRWVVALGCLAFWGTACYAMSVRGTAASGETFVIEGRLAGPDATVKIPVGAITQLSANFAESVADPDDARVESMRLRGDVSISIAGSLQPILIKADSVVLQLTPDTGPGLPKRTRAGAAAHRVLRGAAAQPDADGAQIFLGNVVFDLDTASGPMQIRAARVQHQLRLSEPDVKAGA